MMAAQKKQRPLIRYAGSAAETSIGSEPLGNELWSKSYLGRNPCQVNPSLTQKRGFSGPLDKNGALNSNNTVVTPCHIELLIFYPVESLSHCQVPKPRSDMNRDIATISAMVGGNKPKSPQIIKNFFYPAGIRQGC
jgi:hypothetical protein